VTLLLLRPKATEPMMIPTITSAPKTPKAIHIGVLLNFVGAGGVGAL
jgi:hypothetical protein